MDDELEPDLDEVPQRLRDLVAKLPTDPGVYLMRDHKGKVVYVGKARNLRARVRSYFARSTSDTRAFVALLGRLLADIETVVTNTEKEALLLENNLIKQHRPRFNVNLRDDKQYLVLRLDAAAKFPRLEVVRRIGQDGAKYFGPYHSATGARETLRVVNRHFKLRTCTDNVLESRKRPCLQYQIKRCPAPCVFPIDEAEYGEQVRDVALFLQSRKNELTERLRARMIAASQDQRYEEAASLRDQLSSVDKTLEAQRVVSSEQIDQDVFGLYREGDVVEIAVLNVRQGKLVGHRTFSFDDQEFPDAETMSSFVGLYYDLGGLVPDEVLLPIAIEDADTKADWLREHGKKTRNVQVLVPERGPRVKLVELAIKNAESSHHSRRDREDDALAALEKLQKRLGLRRLPRRIECYDIAHIQGSLTVASMVVFIDGLPDKAEYRKFRLKTAKNDDFASMYETLSRRFRRAREADAKWPTPDLVVIDGGKGQLAIAMAAMHDIGLPTSGDASFDVISLAKERVKDTAPHKLAAAEDSDPDAAATPAPAEAHVVEPQAEVDAAAVEAAEQAAMEAAGDSTIEGGDSVPADPPDAPATDAPADPPKRGRKGRKKKARMEDAKLPDRVFMPRVKDPIRLRPNTSELFLLARVRDEAHRFANAFHRQLRGKNMLRSALEDVPGVGAKRKTQLLRTFGSLKRLREATVEAMAEVPGMTQAAAEAVRAFFGATTDPPEPDPEPENA